MSSQTIVGVAFRLKDGTVYSAPRPARHGGHLLPEGHLPVSHGDITQGFVLDDGTFVDRFEGLLIAQYGGQLIRKTSPVDRLFSEDLW